MDQQQIDAFQAREETRKLRRAERLLAEHGGGVIRRNGRTWHIRGPRVDLLTCDLGLLITNDFKHRFDR